jgi:uncharacterized protein YdiU (UPF0061 family)
VISLLEWMHSSRADFTNTFRELSSGPALASELYSEQSFRTWHANWQQRLEREQRPADEIYAGMRSVNPAVIPRNHRVEEALSAAEEQDDVAPLNRLLEALRSPFDDAASPTYREPPADECAYRTFCGT